MIYQIIKTKINFSSIGASQMKDGNITPNFSYHPKLI